MDTDEKDDLEYKKDNYEWCSNAGEVRRCFILEKLANMEATPEAMLRFMGAVDAWIVSGVVPGIGEVKKLKSVDK